MVKNTHKKDGVALVLILIVVTSITLTVMASIKVMTKSHTRYTTGKSQDGEINTNKASGKFICYKDANGQLHRVLIKYKADGTIDNSENANGTAVSSCIFPINNSVQSYKITLIGGGGGGSVPYAVSDFKKTISTSGDDSIIVGENQTVFKKLFVNQSKYIDTDSANDLIYNVFFANMKVKVKAPDAVIKSGVNGAVGATCSQNIFGSEDALESSALSIVNSDDIYDRTFYYGYEKAEKYPYESVANNNAYFKLGNKKLIAHGGLSALSSSSGTFSPTKCTQSPYNTINVCTNLKVQPYNGKYTEEGVGKCILDLDTTISDSNPNKTYTYKGTDQVSSPISYGSVVNPIFTFFVTFNNTLYEIKQNSSIRFALRENVADIYESNAGEPGEIKEFETKYLTKDVEQASITINASSIGMGGAGGSDSSKNGSNGTATTLELDTRGGKYTLVANGGIGGKSTYAYSLEGGASASSQNNIGSQHTFTGKNGSQSSYQLSGDFGISNLTPGVTKALPTETITKATLPGSSGASGMLKWNGVNENAAIPWIEYITSSGTGIPLSNISVLGAISNYYSYSKNGGAGANGAIVIEW